MFKNTKPFMSKFDDGTNRLRIGVEVPPNGVNLAHYYCPPLTPSENVIIGDNSGFIIENTQQQQSTLMNAGLDNILKNVDGSNIIESELIEITDKFFNDTPLYYMYRLKKMFVGEKASMDGTYYGNSIQITDAYGSKLPSMFKYKIVLTPVLIDTGDHNAYYVEIYTSFQIENGYNVKCTYPSLENNKYDEWVIIPSDEELINPQVFFKKAKSALEAITTPNYYYLEKTTRFFKASTVHTMGIFDDLRTPHLIKVKLDITDDAGHTHIFNYPGDYNGEDYFKVFREESAIYDELKLFKNERQRLTDETIGELTGISNIVSIRATVVDADRSISSVRLFVRPDGTGRLYAKTSEDTGVVSTVPEKNFKKIGDKISRGYSVKFKDRNPIKLLLPRETGSLNQWYMRIQNGRFSKEEDGTTYYYYIPEYYAQLFDEQYGFPYRRILEEKPILISKNTIKIKNTPLYVDTDGHTINNLTVYRKDINGSRWPMVIENWNDKDGTINLVDMISENDDIYIDYMFEEESYQYRGFYKTNDFNIASFVKLDVNPNQHHFMTDTSNNIYSDVSTFRLISTTVYFYIKPAIIEHYGHKVYNKNVIEHSLVEYDREYIEANKLELIGIIYVRPNSSHISLDIIDSRTRGGGIVAEINDELRRELEPESDFYWDIGYWDGEPYNENSIIIVRLDKKILKEHGGRFTEQEVEVAVNKHMASGTLAMIEYVTTYDDDSLKIKNMEISKS